MKPVGKTDPAYLTPGATPEPGTLGDHSAEPGKKPVLDLSASELTSLTDSPARKKSLPEREAKEQIRKADLQAVGTYLVQQHNLIIEATSKRQAYEKDLEAREKELGSRGLEIKEKEAELQSREQELGKGIGGVLKKVDEAHKLENLKPTLVVLHLLKYNLPALEDAFKKVATLKSQESKDEFVRFCSTIVGSELRNTLALNDEINLEDLKKTLTKEHLASVFGEQASKELLEYIAMAIASAKAQAVAPTTKKEIWAARFLEASNKLYPLLPFAGALSVAQAVGQGVQYITPDAVTDFVASWTPELVNSFVSLIQEYVTVIGGSHVVPIALFAIGAMLYYLTQLAYMAKEKVRPTDEETKAKIEEAAMKSKFAQHAVTV